MFSYRAKYKNYNINIFLPSKKSGIKVLILPGLPASRNPEHLVEKMLEHNCIVFYPEYRGSFESSGNFSAKNCISDVKNFYTFIVKSRKVKELYGDTEIDLGRTEKIILCGVSFGSSIALLNSHLGFDKFLFLSPVFSYAQKDIAELVKFDFHSQMKILIKFLKTGFKFTYRMAGDNSLSNFLLGRQGTLTLKRTTSILKDLKKKTLIVHAVQDASYPIEVTKKVKELNDNALISFKFIQAQHSPSSFSDKDLNSITKWIVDK